MNPDVSASNSGSNNDNNVQVRPITSLLVANRGEIARRIMRTARATPMRRAPMQPRPTWPFAFPA